LSALILAWTTSAGEQPSSDEHVMMLTGQSAYHAAPVSLIRFYRQHIPAPVSLFASLIVALVHFSVRREVGERQQFRTSLSVAGIEFSFVHRAPPSILRSAFASAIRAFSNPLCICSRP
jgi:hypothetical protein